MPLPLCQDLSDKFTWATKLWIRSKHSANFSGLFPLAKTLRQIHLSHKQLCWSSKLRRKDECNQRDLRNRWLTFHQKRVSRGLHTSTPRIVSKLSGAFGKKSLPLTSWDQEGVRRILVFLLLISCEVRSPPPRPGQGAGSKEASGEKKTSQTPLWKQLLLRL